MDASAPAPGPRVTIIVVGWRAAPYLSRCLESIASTVPTQLHRTSIVLNEPTDELRTHIAATPFAHDVTVFRTNLGFGAAVNFAAERADTELVVLLNDDCVVEPGWLEELLDTADRRPHAGAVGSTFLHMDRSLQEAGSILWDDGSTLGVGDRGHPRSWAFERQVDYCSGGSLLVRLAAWRAVGGFDERYYPGYYEDVDLALRMAEQGWQTWLSATSVVLHTRGASSVEIFRTFIVERSKASFRARWAAALAQRVPAGQLENAIWKAMGEPQRILVIGDPSQAETLAGHRDLLAGLAESKDVAVALYPRVGSTSDDHLARLGVRVIEDLALHLSDPTVAYDTIVVSPADDGSTGGNGLRERFPSATIVSGVRTASPT